MQLSEKTKNKLKGVMPVTKEEREDALASACMQVKRVLPEFTTKFQNAYSENGFYRPIDNVEWTTGFWTGEIWLAYEYGGRSVKGGRDPDAGFFAPDRAEDLCGSS